MKRKIPVTIISAYRSDVSQDVNWSNTTSLIQELTKHFPDRFKGADGAYQGNEERVFLVTHKDGVAGEDWLKLINIAQKFNQERVLHIDANRFASYWNLNSEKFEPVGMYKETTKEIAEKHGSFVLIDKKYFYARGK